MPAEKRVEVLSLTGYRILVVDDEPDILTFLPGSFPKVKGGQFYEVLDSRDEMA